MTRPVPPRPKSTSSPYPPVPPPKLKQLPRAPMGSGVRNKYSPDTIRVPTEQDRLMTGRLSTVWPLDSMHPEASIHVAILVNDMLMAAVQTIDELKDDIARLSTQEDRDLSSAEKHIAALEQDCEEYKNQILSLEYDVEARDNEIEELQKELN